MTSGSLLSWFKRRILRDQNERWNHQYARGKWKQLKDPIEHARLIACANLLRRHAPNGDVLEIGCGEAILLRQLTADDYRSWLGVDISDVAVAAAQSFAGERVRFVAGDMRTLALHEHYDAIIFTESIYYVSEPAALLKRYARHLKPGGVFIISNFEA
ncbi:MAG TPA: class I SAM-dependent methyltransferase, partial [Candidatus Didemnitutus sp.]|nr:class I SAM-dependent methyltransferase [Candidatus Didemnitutus sp.]